MSDAEKMSRYIRCKCGNTGSLVKLDTYLWIKGQRFAKFQCRICKKKYVIPLIKHN